MAWLQDFHIVMKAMSVKVRELKVAQTLTLVEQFTLSKMPYYNAPTFSKFIQRMLQPALA
jgi:hypothetical protein